MKIFICPECNKEGGYKTSFKKLDKFREGECEAVVPELEKALGKAAKNRNEKKRASDHNPARRSPGKDPA